MSLNKMQVGNAEQDSRDVNRSKKRAKGKAQRQARVMQRKLKRG